jgi:hypothetical protein
MSSVGDSCRAKASARIFEVVDFPPRVARRRRWHVHCKWGAPPMTNRSRLLVAVSSLLGRPREIPGRSAIRLALRLARFEQRVLLVETVGGYRVVPADAPVSRKGDLEIFGALARGSLLLARERF